MESDAATVCFSPAGSLSLARFAKGKSFMAEADGIPHALRHAHTQLTEAIVLGLQQRQANYRFSNAREIYRCVENFVDALDKSGGRDELAKRATLVATLCGPRSEYEKARLKALKSYRGQPRKLNGSMLAIYELRRLLPNPMHLSVVTQARPQIERILDERILGLSDDSRKAFQQWAKACRNIEKQANGLAVDGCLTLLKIHAASEDDTTNDASFMRALRDAAGAEHSVFGHMLEDIRIAADSLVDWLMRNPLTEGTTPDRTDAAKRPAFDVAKAQEQFDALAPMLGELTSELRTMQRVPGVAKAAHAVRQPEVEDQTGNEVPHAQLVKWAEVTLGNSNEGTLLKLIVVQGVTDKSKLREELRYGDSDNRAFNTLLGVVNKKLKQGKTSRKLDAFYWLDGKDRQCIKLLIGDDAKVRHA